MDEMIEPRADPHSHHELHNIEELEGLEAGGVCNISLVPAGAAAGRRSRLAMAATLHFLRDMHPPSVAAPASDQCAPPLRTCPVSTHCASTVARLWLE